MEEKTPQEKKALSYVKDRRNTYGQNDKASRKIIPLRKAQVNRVYRRKVNEILDLVVEQGLENADTLESTARNIKREDWKKASDHPLGEVVERKLERRESHAGNGKTARKKASEFLKSLEIETEQELDGRWIAEAIGMNGVLKYGDTKEDAIESCKSLARAVYLETIGAAEILKVSDKSISILRK